MKGKHKFSPTSGVELSDERHYPGTIPVREALDGSGELTNGELVSQEATALLTRFKECHRRYHEPDPELYINAWDSIQAIRGDEDTPTPWDCWLWYCLAEYLSRNGHEIGWMFSHVEPRCPRCSSRLRYEPSPSGYPNMICGSTCGAETSSDRTVEIYDRIKEVYNTTFSDESIDRLRIF
jgi:hypothetical protein